MDLLIAIGLIVFSAVAGIIGNMIASELYDRTPSFARWLINRAVARLPKVEQERYREEWSAHLNDCAGKIGHVFHACGCFRASYKLRNELLRKGAPLSRPRKRTRIGKFNLHLHTMANIAINELSPTLWTQEKTRAVRDGIRRSGKLDKSLLDEATDRRVTYVRFRNKRYLHIRTLFLCHKVMKRPPH